jgi:hypothetical protein
MAINIGKLNFGKTEIFMLVGQLIVILFYGLFIIYGDGQSADSSIDNEQEASEPI